MIRILFIARYRDATMSRKIALLAENEDLAIRHICPGRWQDELLQVEQATSANESYEQIAIPMIGRPSDPHRTLYRTVTFGIRRFHPHIIHAEEEPDSLSALQITLARRLFAPQARLVLYTWQNINRYKRWYVELVLRATLHESDSVLCANHEATEVLSQLGYRRHTEVLPAIGVDTRVFRPYPRRRGNSGPFVVGYVGRLVAEKGLDTIVTAISQLNQRLRQQEGSSFSARHVELDLIGDGAYRSTLEGLIRAANLTDYVRFVPPLPPLQVAERMSRLDALVLPSRTTSVWKEQFGRVLVEAMACEVPVIGSDSGAIPEVIGDAGLIFPEGDAAALAGQIQRLMESPLLWHDLAERGYVRAMSLFSQEQIAKRTAEYYRHEVLRAGAH